MNTLVPSSYPSSLLGQHSIDGNINGIGFRNSMVQSTPSSSKFVDETGPGQVANEVFIKRAVDHKNREQEKTSSNQAAITVTAVVGAASWREDGVAEFRGPVVHGLVRFAQVNEQEIRIEATFDGLTPGVHSWSVNEYGDLREGAASTGLPYSPFKINSTSDKIEEAAADILGTVLANNSGHAEFVGRCFRLAVQDIIGRSVVLYQSSYKKEVGDAIGAAVIARSSVPGLNACKRLCHCDGTVIWQST